LRLVRAARDSAYGQHAHALGAAAQPAPRRWSDAHEQASFEWVALAVDLDSAAISSATSSFETRG
jgi:hypothetical protein